MFNGERSWHLGEKINFGFFILLVQGGGKKEGERERERKSLRTCRMEKLWSNS